MSDVSLDLSGVEQLKEEIEDLKDSYGDNPVWVVGTNVEYGVYLEFGTEDMPPYPWLLPATEEFKRDPEGFITDTTAVQSIDEIPSTDALVKVVANGLANRATDNVNAQDPSGDRSPFTHPDHPKRDTGNLTADIGAIRVR